MSANIAPRPGNIDLTDEAVAARSRVRVLVVDDNADHRGLMARSLRAAGMQVSAVGSAAAAVSACDQVDLVLLDLRLPGVDGLEVLRSIRARPAAPSVVMVTAAGSTAVAVDAMRAGAVHFVTKEPGYLDALPEVVARAWRHHDLERRAGELRRAAVVLTRTVDHDALAAEVAASAARLTAADRVRLVLVAETAGGDVQLVDAGVDGVIPAPAEAPTTPPAIVSLRAEGGSGGHLEVWTPVPLTRDDHELLVAFAALAATALANARRLEVERRLVRELERGLAARQDFIASISHELRTPLTAIAGFSQTLRLHGSEMPHDRWLDMLGRIERNATELSALVDELLELAAFQGSNDPRTCRAEPLELDRSLRDVLEELEPVLEGHRIEVELVARTVLGDPSLLRRTLTNLLVNAAKFSSEGNPVLVASRVEQDLVVVEITDQGVGMSPWEAEHVFEAFYRTSSSVSEAVRGSGIGLALVANYVRAMGGEVGVRSQPGIGSTFWFTLPRPPAGPDGAPPPA